MNTEREYLYSLGLTKAATGRGRFSREAHAALTKARSEGMQFKEKPVIIPGGKTIVKSTPKPVISTAPVEKPEPGEIQDGYGQAFLRYGRLDMEFEGFDEDGKRHVVSGRNACSCGWSLVGHTCDDATALVGGGERIKVHPIV